MFFAFWKAADVPSWMFIGWINQMVAILDKKEGKAVHAILQEITQTYPQVNWNFLTDFLLQVFTWEKKGKSTVVEIDTFGWY